MLTDDTRDYLNIRCNIADREYDQGGMTYIYSYGKSRAHTVVKQPIENLCHERQLDSNEVDKLDFLFEVSLGNPDPNEVSQETKEFVRDLLQRLYKEHPNMYCFLSEYEHDGYSISANIIWIVDNDFYSLDLFWSLD